MFLHILWQQGKSQRTTKRLTWERQGKAKAQAAKVCQSAYSTWERLPWAPCIPCIHYTWPWQRMHTMHSLSWSGLLFTHTILTNAEPSKKSRGAMSCGSKHNEMYIWARHYKILLNIRSLGLMLLCRQNAVIMNENKQQKSQTLAHTVLMAAADQSRKPKKQT